MSFLDRRVRGFRLVDLIGVTLLVALILGVYLAKTIAGRERAEIAQVERQIGAEKARIRLLQAEVSHLEQPARIERLSSAYLGMAPVSIKRETSVEDVGGVARPAVAAVAKAAEPRPAIDPTGAPQAPAPTAAPEPAQ